ncbi:MAG TPA: rod shape-determining protein RodA [Lachnospiraceae bacterium]|nr:rod shape-determining protein RodA [Lachnospiraceae bacterium]HBB59637.1 rod shape-determining protein RodA [Lachnospiraceae bacterium]HCR99357.1 rod shape-determining protein RodA [Lachnospiraceae bacterium]
MSKYSIRNYNFLLAIAAIALSVYGIFIIGSAKESVQSHQIQGLVLGVIVMIVISLIRYDLLLRLSWLYYVLAVGLLIMVEIAGESVNNAKRWIVIAGIQFQPSEAAKILIIMFFASFISKREEKLNSARNLLLSLLLIGVPVYLIYDEPDLSTSIVMLVIFAGMLYIGGLSYRIIGAVAAIAIPAFIIGSFLILQPNQEIIKDYQQTRILAWLQPDKYQDTAGYQQQNSIVAIGSGRLTGKGYKNNEVGSVKNGNFISEPQTDFIIAVAGEELGFAGCVLIVALFALVTGIIIHIGRGTQELSGTLICAGVATHIGFQSFANIGVATGLLPNTGLPLPFISYGSTSLICLLAEIGLVLNVGLCSGDGRQRSNLSFSLD